MFRLPSVRRSPRRRSGTWTRTSLLSWTRSARCCGPSSEVPVVSAGAFTGELLAARRRSDPCAQGEDSKLVSRRLAHPELLGKDRVYHHTAPVNMMYGLHEAERRPVPRRARLGPGRTESAGGCARRGRIGVGRGRLNRTVKLVVTETAPYPRAPPAHGRPRASRWTPIGAGRCSGGGCSFSAS